MSLVDFHEDICFKCWLKNGKSLLFALDIFLTYLLISFDGPFMCYVIQLRGGLGHLGVKFP